MGESGESEGENGKLLHRLMGTESFGQQLEAEIRGRMVRWSGRPDRSTPPWQPVPNGWAYLWDECSKSLVVVRF